MVHERIKSRETAPDIAIEHNSFAVTDGHYPVLADILNKETFVNVNLVLGKGEKILEKQELHDFENIGEFKYKFYPEEDAEYLSLSKEVRFL
jgi:hypothetical protein